MIRDFDHKLLRKNHSIARPTRILYIDTETKQRQAGEETHHRMWFGWTCYVQRRKGSRNDTEQWRYWEDTETMWRYITSKACNKTALYVIGHNIFFDLQASDFFYWMTKWGWVLDFWYDKSLSYALFIHKDGKSIKCLSTTNYFPVSLEKLGELVGLPKLDVDFETTPKDELVTYCRRDVEICKAVFEYYIDFIDRHDLGKFSVTRASQAMSAFRHRFMNRKIYIHQEDDIRQFEAKAYHGGRVECFELGEIRDGPFVSLDINSMYPFVMKTFRYPTKLIDVIEHPTEDQVKNIIRKYCVVAHCFLVTDDPAYAIKRFKKVIFPVGSFWAYLCTQGIRYALEQGDLYYVDKICVYDADWIFVDYVNYFYDLKQRYSQEGNKIMTRIAKDFLNSLYGKFAQRAPLIDEEIELTFTGYSREETYDMVTGKSEIVTRMLNKVIVQWGDEISDRSFVAIAAHVTEYARFHLWKIIKGIGLDRVLYCDTDSVKIRKRDLPYVKYKIDPYELGALKVEEEFNHFHIYGPKDYETEGTVKLKGVPASAKRNDDGTYTFTYFPRQETHLRRNITRFYIAKEMVKKLDRKYTKGRVLDNGKTAPYRFNEQCGLSWRLQ